MNTDSTSYLYHMTGGLPSAEIWAAVTFALLGLILMTAVNVRKGILKNPNTANKFSWQHFGWDTVFRIFLSTLITMIVIFISIRFVYDFTGQTLTMFYSFGIGLGIDKATQWITKTRKKAE